MKTNKSITVYHKVFNKNTRLDEWVRYNIANAMVQGGKGASISEGFIDKNDISIWIPYTTNDLSNVEIKIGDIVVCEAINQEITKQSDLTVDSYNITTLIDRDYGSKSMQHLFIGAK